MSLKVGDIVEPSNPGRALRSGCNAYNFAIVVQAEPLILVSEEADMKWSATVKPEHFNAIGTASDEQLAKCMTRLAD
jgi:hypothetical protein